MMTDDGRREPRVFFCTDHTAFTSGQRTLLVGPYSDFFRRFKGHYVAELAFEPMIDRTASRCDGNAQTYCLLMARGRHLAGRLGGSL
jgi:hypothetical protein